MAKGDFYATDLFTFNCFRDLQTELKGKYCS